MKKKILAACVALIWIMTCAALAQSEYARLGDENAVQAQDVAAWLEIPGAQFTMPVMQRAQDDAYYASHSADGAEFQFGTLYTQAAYNTRDFSDPVTIVYGSSGGEGAPFRNLQETFSGRFDECTAIYLHLPDGTVEYEVFAAIPYSSINILHYYDFSAERRFEGFFDDVYSTRRLGMHLDASRRPEFGQQVLILSTGLRGDPMQRYLVMAKPVVQ